jgi:hypothetical protein
MRDTRRYLLPPDQEAVLHGIADSLLEEEGQSVPDWQLVGPQIATEIDRQSGHCFRWRSLPLTEPAQR